MKHTDFVRPLLPVALGTAMIGLGINAFNIPNQIAEGGITGLSIILKLWLNLDPGLTVLALNIPLLVWGIFALGWRSTWLSVFGVATLSFWLWLFGGIRLPLDDDLLAAICAGLAMGGGLGVVFRYGGTTGGVDIMVRVLNKRFGWPMGRTMFACDVVVLSLSAIYLDIHKILYTIIAVFIGSRIIDLVENGANGAKSVTVVSEQASGIAAALRGMLDKKFVLIGKDNGLANEEVRVLHLVCARGDVASVKRVVRDLDKDAFLAVSEISEVIGRWRIDDNYI